MSRFIQEAKSASALNHPNIITIYEVGEFEETQFIAMEYIQGKTLSQKMQDGPLSVNSVVKTAIQIASALQAVHQADIIHRDIKPDNIMIRPDELIKVLDFGMAKLSEKTKAPVTQEAETAIKPMTIPGMIVGTADYMSPEQARGQKIDARSDLYKARDYYNLAIKYDSSSQRNVENWLAQLPKELKGTPVSESSASPNSTEQYYDSKLNPLRATIKRGLEYDKINALEKIDAERLANDMIEFGEILGKALKDPNVGELYRIGYFADMKNNNKQLKLIIKSYSLDKDAGDDEP